MVDTLVLRLERERIWTKAAVYGVSRTGDGFSLEVEGGETVSAKQVIVAAPGPRVAPALEALVPGAARTLAAIPFASSATILLGYRREDVAHPLDGYGMVIPQTEGLRATALSFVSTKFPHRAPAGHVLLRGFLGGVRDAEVMKLTDEEMVETVKREMSAVLGLRGQPAMTRVFRWPDGTPQLEVGHLERMAAVERELAAVPGLHLTGAGIRSTGIPDSVADGTRAGDLAAERAR
jgi:oxygen-dependent protoporphyrinogen oxidase